MTTTSSFAPLGRAGLLAAAVAAVGNLVVYALARTLGVALLLPLQPGAAPVLLPVAMVLGASLAGAAAAAAAFALLTRFGPRRTRLFPIVALVFLLLSLGAPLTLAATDGATRATLVLMHLLAGGSITYLLAARGRG
ncbi:MAG TPA: DUF6069 family protein [Chloroflexota bacterium]|nr:DUF6069 family protein [Chloroflexota bacterium]